MATNRIRRLPGTITFNLGQGGSDSSSSIQYVSGFDYSPDKVSGSFITFPDGTKFRRSTTYARCSTAFEPGPSQYTRGINTEPVWLNKPAFIRSTPGGIPEDIYTLDYMNALKRLGVSDCRTFPNIPTGRRNEANTKSLLNLADQKVNLGENLATLSQTMRLMSNPLETLIKGLRTVGKKGEFREFLRLSANDIRRNGGTTSKAAEEYLKYVYGWKPLMQDIHGLVEMAKSESKNPLLIHSMGRSVIDPYLVHKYHNPSNLNKTELGPLTGFDRVTTSIWARIDPNYSGTRALNQLGLLNPASLAWELVPWSFVIDWVLPIGSVLQALTAPAGLIFVDGSISRRLSVKGPYTNWWARLEGNFPKYNIQQDTHAGGSFRYDGYYREPLATWPSVGLWTDPDPLRGDRVFKALALGILSLRSLR